MEFRKQLVKSFAVIFSEDADEESSNRFVGESFAEKWSWFGVMYRLTNGNIVNLEKITQLNLLECLTWLSYEADLESQNKIKHGGQQ